MLEPLVPAIAEWQRDDYVLSSDPNRIDVYWVHRQLTENSYWAREQSLMQTRRALSASLCFGIYLQEEQVGFARLITDYSRFAYLSDVIIEPAQRGRGLGGWLATTIVKHPELHTVKRWLLATDDAHEVYRRAGWQPVAKPERLMEFTPPHPEDRIP